MKQIWTILLWVPLAAAQIVPDTYIVQLTGPPAGSARRAARGQGLLSRRAAVRSEQDQVRYALRQANIQVLDSVDLVANALVVSAPGADPDALAGTPGVARVYPVREFKPLLDHAVQLHKAVEAWQRLGGAGSAGAGVKIAILDTGLDFSHPAFLDSSLPMPDGFPRGNTAADLALTSTKVIVARSYSSDPDPQDHFGHGTGVAMAAAGASTGAPLATLSGMAPKAYLGIYKITTGTGGSASDATILRAINDALADGMDVINLSFGSLLAPRPEDDILDLAIDVATSSGAIFVVANGNDGPAPNTVASPASSPAAISVGASFNDRLFSASAKVDGLAPYVAVPPQSVTAAGPITGALVDVAPLDPTGLACNPLPEGSLGGKIAFILRGSCPFETKLNNAQRAGATAALLYTHATDPDVASIRWTVGAATLPAEMVSYVPGLEIKARLAGNPETNVTLQFAIGPMYIDPNRVAGFSAAGPSSGQGIKPDLVAVGSEVYTAAQRSFPGGTLYDGSGFMVVDGTSFSSPITAGAAALLKQARPGLTTAQYRSLLINSATALTFADGRPAAVQQAGSGVLNVTAAIDNTVSVQPTSLSFGEGDGAPDRTGQILITNLGTESGLFTISPAAQGDGPVPDISPPTVWLDPGASAPISVHFAGTDLAPGAYQGILQIQPGASAVAARVPYWYGVAGDTAAYLTVLEAATSGQTSALLSRAIYFRVTDAAGIPVTGTTPTVTALTDGASVPAVRLVDGLVPGAFAADVVLGPARGANVFQVSAGDSLRLNVQITATTAGP